MLDSSTYNGNCQNRSYIDSLKPGNDHINPLLTQDSKHPTSKIFSAHCKKPRKPSLSSYSRNTFRKNQGFRSFTRNKVDALEGNQKHDTSNINGISDKYPLCDSDSQYVEQNNFPVATKKMIQSRSYSNLLKSARFNSDKPSNVRDRIYSNKTYNSKMSSDETYRSSIHQCKPKNLGLVNKNMYNRQNENPHNYEFNDERDNCISNNSETMSSNFNGVQVNEKGFISHSNISTVPNYEEPNYSSIDEIAADIISKPKIQNSIYDRYDTNSQERQFHVDTNPNALVLQDICQNTNPTTVKNRKSHKMIQMLKNASGSQSTRNMIVPSSTGIKRTVSINLYENNRDTKNSSPESIMNKKQIGMTSYNRHANSSKFSTLKKRAKFTRSNNRSNIENSLSKNYQRFGNRKNTLEDSPSLANLSKQLQKTEKTLTSISRKQSQQMSNIHGKLQMLEHQLVFHKNKQNMSKFIKNNSKSRNSISSSNIKQSKTTERIYHKTTHKPFSTIMLSSIVAGKNNKQSTTDKKQYKKQIPKYIQKSFSRAMNSLNKDYNHTYNVNSCSDSEPSDKTTMKNVNDVSTDQMLSLSDDKDSKGYDTKGCMRAGELMNIQEEQEYTTNEAADVLMESS